MASEDHWARRDENSDKSGEKMGLPASIGKKKRTKKRGKETKDGWGHHMNQEVHRGNWS